jgi:hypothetical protein
MKNKEFTFTLMIDELRIKPSKSEREHFNEWMLNKVKSIHYSNNVAMTNAYDRIEEKFIINPTFKTLQL